MVGTLRMDRILQQIAFWTAIIFVTASAVVAGLVIRRYAWEQTEPVRYTDDIDNAFRQGSAALRVGYLNRYDQDKTDPFRLYGQMPLDYAPGRLAIATLWAHWVREKVDGPQPSDEPTVQWRMEFYQRARYLKRQYELCAPMLMVNITGEVLSSVAIFFLVRRYTASRNRPDLAGVLRPILIGGIVAGVLWLLLAFLIFRNDLPLLFNRSLLTVVWDWISSPARQSLLSNLLHQEKPFLLFSWQFPALVWAWFVFPAQRSAIQGLVGALFLWFNPALIWNAHCWPQWDSWVLPFFLWAIFAASCDCWFIAGSLIAAGAMFKGQILFGAPIFLLWPLWQLRLLSIVRWIVGFATATAVVTAGWLVRTAGAMPSNRFIPGHVNDAAIAWIISMAIAFVLMVLLLRLRWIWYAKLPVAVAFIGLISWRFFQLDSTHRWLPAIVFMLAWAALVPVLLWRRWVPAIKMPAVFLMTVVIAFGLRPSSLDSLRNIDVLLLAVGGFALADILFETGDGDENTTAIHGRSWDKLAIRMGGVALGICLLSARIPRSFMPLFYGGAVVMTGAILLWVTYRISDWSWRIRLPIGWVLTSLVMWPFLRLTDGYMLAASVATMRVGLVVFYAPRRAIAYTAAGWMGAVLLLCIPLFDGSQTWFYTGLVSPTSHRANMTNGRDDNLAGLLSEEWRWDLMDPVITLGPGPMANAVDGFITQVDPRYSRDRDEPVQLPIKYLLLTLWIVAVVLSSIGAAMHDLSRQPRFLIAVSSPWIALFAVMAQMHQRYLLWGSAMSSAAAALNPGYALLHLLLSVVAMSQEMRSMFERLGRAYETPVNRIIEGWHPGMGWAVVLTAAIFVYLAARPLRSRNDGAGTENRE